MRLLKQALSLLLMAAVAKIKAVPTTSSVVATNITSVSATNGSMVVTNASTEVAQLEQRQVFRHCEIIGRNSVHLIVYPYVFFFLSFYLYMSLTAHYFPVSKSTFFSTFFVKQLLVLIPKLTKPKKPPIIRFNDGIHNYGLVDWNPKCLPGLKDEIKKRCCDHINNWECRIDPGRPAMGYQIAFTFGIFCKRPDHCIEDAYFAVNHEDPREDFICV